MTKREKRVRRRAAIFAALTVVALTTACAGAQAKTVQVGSPLTGSFTPVWLALPNGGYCGFHCGMYPLEGTPNDAGAEDVAGARRECQ